MRIIRTTIIHGPPGDWPVRYRIGGPYDPRRKMELTFANGDVLNLPNLGDGPTMRTIHQAHEAVCNMHGAIRIENLTAPELVKLATHLGIELRPDQLSAVGWGHDRYRADSIRTALVCKGIQITTGRELILAEAWSALEMNEFCTRQLIAGPAQAYAGVGKSLDVERAVSPALPPRKGNANVPE